MLGVRATGKRAASLVALVVAGAALAITGLVVVAPPSAAEDPLVAWDEDAFERAFFPGLERTLTFPACLTTNANVTIEVRSPLDVPVHTIGPVSVPARGSYNSSGDCFGQHFSSSLVPHWNGRDSNGQLVPVGVYTLVIRADAGAGAVTDSTPLTIEPATATGAITAPPTGSTIGDTVALTFVPGAQFDADGPFPITQVSFLCRWQTGWATLATVDGPVTGSASFSPSEPVVVPPQCNEGASSLGVSTTFRDGGPSNTSQSFTSTNPHPVTFATSPEVAFQDNGLESATFFPRLEQPRTTRFCISEAGQVTVEIRRDGALVRSLFSGFEPEPVGSMGLSSGTPTCFFSGSEFVEWDGKDTGGAFVTGGAYEMVLRLVPADGGAATSVTEAVLVDAAPRVGVVETPAPGAMFTERFAASFRPDADFDGTPHEVTMVDFVCGTSGPVVRATSATEGVWSVDEPLPVNCPQGEVDIAPTVYFRDPAGHSHNWKAPERLVQVSTPVQATWSDFAATPRVLFPNLDEQQSIEACASRDAVVDIDVLDAEGDLLRNLVVDGDLPRADSFTGTRSSCQWWSGRTVYPAWDGTLADGTVLPTGDYQLRLTARDTDDHVSVDILDLKIDASSAVGEVTSPEMGTELVGEITATFRPAERFDGTPHDITYVGFPCLNGIYEPNGDGDFTTTVDAPDHCGNLADFGPWVSFTDELGASHSTQTQSYPVNGQVRVGWVDSSVSDRALLHGLGETMSLRFCLSRPASVRTEVVNSGGAVVRTFGPAEFEPAGAPGEDGGCSGSSGRVQASWDGKAADGTAFPDGTYTVRIVATAGSVTDTDTATIVLDDVTSLGTPLEPVANATLAGLVHFTYDPDTSYATEDVQVCVQPPGGSSGCRTILNPSGDDGHWRTTNPASNLRDGAATVVFRHRVLDSFGFAHTYQPADVPVTVNTTSIPLELTVTPSDGLAPLATDISFATSDPLLRPLDYELSFGDNSLPVLGTLESPYPDVTVEHAYPNPGSYLVRVTVDNHVDPTVTRSVTVIARDPAATTVPTTTPPTTTPPTTTPPTTTPPTTTPPTTTPPTTVPPTTVPPTTSPSTTPTTSPSGSTSTVVGPGATTTTLRPDTTTTAPPRSTTSTSRPAPTTSTTLGQPAVVVAPDTVPPGGQITITATGWGRERPLGLVLRSDPVDLGRIVTDGSGRASGSFIVPADTPVGVHQIEATGLDRFSNRVVARATLVVGVPEPAEPNPGPGTGGAGGPGTGGSGGAGTGGTGTGGSGTAGAGAGGAGAGGSAPPAQARGTAAAVPFADPGRTTVAPGGRVEVLGEDFGPSTPGTITLTRDGATTGIQIGQFTADQLGNVLANPSIPENLPPGLHRLRLVGLDAAGNPHEVVVPIYVGNGSVLGSGSTLPRTGSKVGDTWFVGFGLCLLGAFLVVLSRLGVLRPVGRSTRRPAPAPYRRRRR